MLLSISVDRIVVIITAIDNLMLTSNNASNRTWHIMSETSVFFIELAKVQNLI